MVLSSISHSKRSITPVVSVILMIVIAVGLAAATYLFFSGQINELLAQTERQVEVISDISILQISYVQFSGIRIAIYDIDKDRFAVGWGWYNSTKIARELFECGYYVDLLTSEELDKIYNYDVFILSTGEMFPVTKPMDIYNPTINYEEVFQDYVVNKGKNFVLISAYPLFYPGYINKTTGLPVICHSWCPKISQTIINRTTIYFCDGDRDGSYDYYNEYQCITYKQITRTIRRCVNGRCVTYKIPYYLCNDFVHGYFEVVHHTARKYFGLEFKDVLCLREHNPCNPDLCNAVKSPIAKKLFPGFRDTISASLRPMYIWNNPSNPFLGKIGLIHLWNDTEGSKTTDNTNASHITIALYPSDGKIFHIFGSKPNHLDELGLDFLCRVAYVLTSYDFDKDKFTRDFEDIIYPIRLTVYNPSQSPVELNNTHFSIGDCLLKLVYNETFLTDTGKSIIYPKEQIVLKVKGINCYLERNKEYNACIIYKGKKLCGIIRVY